VLAHGHSFFLGPVLCLVMGRGREKAVNLKFACGFEANASKPHSSMRRGYEIRAGGKLSLNGDTTGV
jgi:hypothetical protein